MGSKQSKDKDAEAPESPKSSGVTGITSEVSMSSARERSVIQAQSSAASRRRTGKFYWANILEVLKQTMASPEQMDFIELWCSAILQLALPKAVPQHQCLSVSSDLQSLEIRVTAPEDLMISLAQDFVKKIGCDDTMVNEMKLAQDELQGNNAGQCITLWCRLKRMGVADPAVDAGFTLHGDIDWSVADLLMPPVADQDALRDHATQELTAPCAYSCSLLPVQPEKALSFEMPNGAAKKSLLGAFFFFKSLGFVKPKDNVVRCMSASQASCFGLCASLGPAGLTRLSLVLVNSTRKVAEDLAVCLDLHVASAALDAIGECMGTDATLVDYAAESRGYAVYLGFVG